MSSFIADKIVMDGLTYDDVLLIPAYSEVLSYYRLEHTFCYGGNGYRYGIAHGHRHSP